MKLPQSILLILSLSLLLQGCNEQTATTDDSLEDDHYISQTLYTAVAHPERPDKDQQRDARRKPAQVLEILGVTPGMTVVEIMSGGGYYTELLSRVVGSNGKVYSHNNKMYYDFQSDKFVTQRFQDNRLPNAIRWDKELNDLQLPAESVDAVFLMLVYHDLYWSENSPQQVIASLFNALKPGGTLAIVDHSAAQNSGEQAAKDLHGIHRIDEQLVKDTILQAGFMLEAESDILRNPDDPRDKAFFDKSLLGKPTDRFVLRFKKPTNFAKNTKNANRQ